MKMDTYLVEYTYGDVDGYDYKLFEAINDEELLKKAKKYAKYEFMGENKLYLNGFTIVTDSGVKKMFTLVDEKWMKELVDDSEPEQLAEYEKDLPNGICIWADGDPKRLK